VKYLGGVDAFQALELALGLIAIELSALNKEHNGQLRWECGEHGDLGFPHYFSAFGEPQR
jgi:hypothetical protein